jgi:hypothetical protein
MRLKIYKGSHVKSVLLLTLMVALLIASLSGCSAQPPPAAQTALKVILGEYPIIYAESIR